MAEVARAESRLYCVNRAASVPELLLAGLLTGGWRVMH